MKRPEQDLQKTCVALLELAVPRPPAGPMFSAINPVPAKSKAVAGISKAMGLRAGVPDLMLLFRGRTIFVEFKADNKGLSEKQEDMALEITEAGGVVEVVRSLDEFLRLLWVYQIPHNVAIDVP